MILIMATQDFLQDYITQKSKNENSKNKTQKIENKDLNFCGKPKCGLRLLTGV